MSRSLRTVALVLAVLASASFGAFVVPADAGAPKQQHLSALAIDAHGAVIATIAVGQQRIATVLAQLHSKRVLRRGHRCRPMPTRPAMQMIAHRLHLNLGVRLAQVGGASYLYQPRDGGRYDTPRRSYNWLLVAEGLATVDARAGAYRADLLAAQRRARHAHRGLWRCRPGA